MLPKVAAKLVTAVTMMDNQVACDDAIHDRVMKQMPFIQIALWYIKFDFPYYSIRFI